MKLGEPIPEKFRKSMKLGEPLLDKFGKSSKFGEPIPENPKENRCNLES